MLAMAAFAIEDTFFKLTSQTLPLGQILLIFGVIAYNALMVAMRTGEVSAVTPFRYSRLLFGIAFGVLLFDETFDLAMLVGCSLIVLAGLFILWRSKAVLKSVE